MEGFGDVAQLGERYVRNVQAVGSIPSISTKQLSFNRLKRPNLANIYRPVFLPDILCLY